MRLSHVVPIGLAALFAAACFSATAPVPAYVGTYTLRTVDKDTVPFNAGGLVFGGGSVTMRVDSTFEDISIWGFPNLGSASADTARGRYAFEGDSLAFRYADPALHATARLTADGALVLTWSGHPYRYTR